MLGRSCIGVLSGSAGALGESSGTTFLSGYYLHLWVVVGFALRQPPHHGGRRATSSSWVTSCNVATPEQGRPSPTVRQKSWGSTAVWLAGSHPETDWSPWASAAQAWVLCPVQSPRVASALPVIWLSDELKGEGFLAVGSGVLKGRPRGKVPFQQRPEGGERLLSC